MVYALIIVLLFFGTLVSAIAWVLWSWPTKATGGERPKEAVDTQSQRKAPSTTKESPEIQSQSRIVSIGWDRFVGIIDRAFHVAIIGETGSGKTTMAEAVMRSIDGRLFVLDPNHEPGKWGGIDAVTTDDEDGYGPLDDGARAVFAEMRDRVIRKRRGEPASERLNVFWDEVNDHMEESKDAGVILRRLVKRGRSYAMKVFIFPQSKRVASLGLEGHGDTVMNLAWVYLGDQARGVLAGLLRNRIIDQGGYDWLVSEQYLAVVEYAGVWYSVDVSSLPRLAQGPSLADRQWVPPVRESPETQSHSGITLAAVQAAYILGQWKERKSKDASTPELSGRALDEAITGKKGGRSSVEWGKTLANVRAMLADSASWSHQEDNDGAQGA